MDHTMLARVYSLVAEMEALKAEIEVLKREYPKEQTGGHCAYLFTEKADQIRNIASQLQTLSY